MQKNDIPSIPTLHSLRIPLSDGCYLAATLYRPRESLAPKPVIFAMTPYTRDRLHDRGMYFAAADFAFAAVDVRGRGDSDGEFEPHVHEGDDGYNVTEWIAGQEFCNGQVAMYGGSYLGYVQWMTAARNPRNLCTIVPTASPFLGVDVPMRGNIFSSFQIRWLAILHGKMDWKKMVADDVYWSDVFSRHYRSGAAFRTLDETAGFPSGVFQQWLDHPEQSTYWDAMNPCKQNYERVELPILTITGMYDGDQAGALEHYIQHTRDASATGRKHHYLVIGPWDHAGCGAPQRVYEGIDLGKESVIDMLQLHRDWYTWTMKSGRRPRFLRRNVTYYVMEADRWRYADSLQEVTGSVLRLFLHSDVNPTDVFRSGALLETQPSSNEADRYLYDPTDVTRATLEGIKEEGTLTDQRMLYQSSGRCLVYHTLPFDRDLEVSGFFKLSAWISIDQPDTDIRVAIFEISIDGSSILLSSDAIRARYRGNLRAARLIDTQEPLRYDFERFTFVSRLIRKGRRLRVVIGPNDSIHQQKNYNGGKTDVANESVQDSRTVTVKLYHDACFRSAIYIPLGREDEMETEPCPKEIR